MSGTATDDAQGRGPVFLRRCLHSLRSTAKHLLFTVPGAIKGFSRHYSTQLAAAMSYHVLFSIVPLVVILALVLTAIVQAVTQATDELADAFAFLGPLSSAIAWSLGILIPLLISFVTFAILYRLVPSTRPRMREVMPGASIAAIAFNLLAQGFAIYLANFSNYNALYGALGAFFGFLLFVYLSAMIILVGRSSRPSGRASTFGISRKRFVSSCRRAQAGWIDFVVSGVNSRSPEQNPGAS